MTILDPSTRRWDVTPKRRIVTTSHRIAFDSELGSKVAAAQAVQSTVYDATLEHLDRHGPKPWMVPSGGPDSVLKWLTRERRQHSDNEPRRCMALRAPSADKRALTLKTTRRHGPNTEPALSILVYKSHFLAC